MSYDRLEAKKILESFEGIPFYVKVSFMKTYLSTDILDHITNYFFVFEWLNFHFIHDDIKVFFKNYYSC